MIERPRVQYARAEDGTSLAYTVFGEGDRTILVAFSSFMSHVERDWDHPGRARFYELLAGFARVVVTDRRNMGLSDPGRASGTLETIANDLVAVLDATETEQASLVTVGTQLALGLPVVAPGRIDRAVLYNVPACWIEMPDHPGVSQADVDRWLATHEARVRDGDTRYWTSLGGLTPAQAGVTPGNSLSHQRWFITLDARELATRITQPVLLIRTEGATIPVGATTWLEDHLADVTRVDLDGENQEPYLDEDLAGLVDLIEEFLTGRRTARAGERRLATIVFTDIVGSTTLATELGAAVWRGRLDAHDRLTRQTVERFGGTYVKSTGDGALATFLLPDAAVGCVAALHDELDVPIRAGAHVGVIEVRGDDVSGLAVHTAARIADLGDAGDTVVSAGVLDGAPTPGWVPVGPTDLDGIDEPWQLYRSARDRREASA